MLTGIKSVFVAITEEGLKESHAALGYALSLAKAANAHLTVEAAATRYAIPYSMIDDFGRALMSSENRRIAKLTAAVAEATRAEADFAGVVSTVEAEQSNFHELCERLLNRARVADITVVDAEPSVAELDRGLMEALLFESGRPLLIVPPGHSSFDARHVLVAWDGGACAARAVADALPILRAAESVEVLSVAGAGELDGTLPGTDLAPHLARHGIKVTVNLADTRSGNVADIIRSHAVGSGAGLIVAGAYRHSRLREFLLGGVTQSLLRECTVPLHLSH
ncbi:MAG: universal stress protein [Bosea sp.]|uniref:universal stress protein n=1 Tax=Bosea sp. (in: a-proteobacteria) TaxID=1871050 RepID=UPI00239CCA51|nr:universal stress protein [Bosea sp. (in: a-proteobacteria)]MCP4737516.1 universal stress protein [Bosea sp. (in: a-proteobacteria)]